MKKYCYKIEVPFGIVEGKIYTFKKASQLQMKLAKKYRDKDVKVGYYQLRKRSKNKEDYFDYEGSGFVQSPITQELLDLGYITFVRTISEWGTEKPE
jgi:hypothetical protein